MEKSSMNIFHKIKKSLKNILNFSIHVLQCSQSKILFNLPQGYWTSDTMSLLFAPLFTRLRPCMILCHFYKAFLNSKILGLQVEPLPLNHVRDQPHSKPPTYWNRPSLDATDSPRGNKTCPSHHIVWPFSCLRKITTCFVTVS